MGDNSPDSLIRALEQKPGQGSVLLSQQVFDASMQAAPDSGMDKFALTTEKGAENLGWGLLHAVRDDFKLENIAQTGAMIGGSAVLGGILKVALPETGWVGKVVGLGLAAGFAYGTREPIVSAYHQGMNAKTMGDIDQAGVKLGDAGGAVIVNTAISGAGYRLGAGFTGKVLATEAFDSFAEAKYNLFNRPVDTMKSWMPGSSSPEALAKAQTLGIASRYELDGEKASLISSKRTDAPKGTVKGDVDPDKEISVSVYAQTKGSDFLRKRYISRISTGDRALTTAEIAEKFGAKTDAVDAIDKWATDRGLKRTEVNMASGRITLTGSVSLMEKAFGTKLQEVEHPNGFTYRHRTGMISVTTDVAPHVKGVLGLDNTPQFHTNYVRLKDLPAAAAGSTGAARPEGIVGRDPGAAATPNSDGARPVSVDEAFKAYNADPRLDGAGMTTGFLSMGGTLPEGWEKFSQDNDIDPNLTEVRNANEGGAQPKPDPRGANGENGLDWIIHKFGLRKAKTVMITVDNNDAGMANGLDRATFAKEGESQITHFSISWGQFEDGWTDQARLITDEAAQRAALKGITVTAAAGDNGAGDNSPSRKQQVDIPAGLEHITAAGGTRLILNPDGTWKAEVGWDGMGATGGGRSMKTARPIWQKFLKLPPNLNGSTFDGRALPDVSANADPRSGWNTFTDDGMQAIGGTSASAPALAVIAAKISLATGKPTGFWNPELYNMGQNHKEVFHDIVVGRNSDAGVKGYPAGPGYDLDTGWGSIDVGKYIEVRQKLNNMSATAKTFSIDAPRFLLRNQATTPAWGVPVVGYVPFTTADTK